MTTVYIDADACPVTRETLAIARAHNVPVVMIANHSQNLSRYAGREGVEIVQVSSGRDVADFAIVTRLQSDDIVVTGDIGLAAMALGRAHALSFRGRVFAPETIDMELALRHAEQQHRRGGGRTRGPSPFEDEDREHFIVTLEGMLDAAGTMTGRVRVKICGVTDGAGARAAVAAGADAVGFVFAESPRQVDVTRALAIAATIPPFIARVAVFRHPDPREVLDVVGALRPDLVQTELAAHLVEALGGRTRLLPVVHDGADLERDISYVLDILGDRTPILLEAAGRGGRGVAPHYERAAALARRLPLVLAGGLRPDNVAAAIATVRPYAVDVSSGVESSPGVKDPDLVARFVAAASDCAGLET